MDRPGLIFGIIAILVGLGVGYLMLAFPENTNPNYPAWVALLAPLVFVLGGILACAHALGAIRVVGFAFAALALCLLALVNWGAFFSDSVRCRQSVSFLGVELFARYPSEADCQAGLRLIMMYVDAIVLVVLALAAWHKRKSSRA
jgi:hypothetical protein